ncbi:MAG: hypothetical protein WHT46_01210 [Candidatus Geothermincolales bacterium]
MQVQYLAEHLVELFDALAPQRTMRPVSLPLYANQACLVEYAQVVGGKRLGCTYFFIDVARALSPYKKRAREAETIKLANGFQKPFKAQELLLFRAVRFRHDLRCGFENPYLNLFVAGPFTDKLFHKYSFGITSVYIILIR